MGRIKLLPPLVINQIAAGECIERPASIVKELVENSLDAGARNIEINIEEAGNRLIQIIDDGCGMDEEELPMSLTSHATSKLETIDDLYTIKTMGFRGEAMASIAAVSEITVCSAIKGSHTGHKIDCKNGNISCVRPFGMAPGTIVEVRNLFFNVPARRKFLKSKTTEMGHITDTVVRLALSAYNVSFKLSHHGRTLFQLSEASTPELRIKDLLFSEHADLVEVLPQPGKYRLKAYLALPNQHRSNSDWQHCFLNGRYIKDRAVSRALQDSYKEFLPERRYSIAVLYLEMDPSFVDVNVHPTKAEVRFREPQEIYRLIFRTVYQKLGQMDLSQKIPLFDDALIPAPTLEELTGAEQGQSLEKKPDPSENAESSVMDVPSGKNGPPPYLPLSREGIAAYRTEASSKAPLKKVSSLFLEKEASLAAPPQKESQVQESRVQARFEYAGEKEEKYLPHFQVRNSYLVVETEQGILIVDQHAAHERIVYERLRRQIRQEKIVSQPLLFPEVIKLSAQEMSVFSQWASHLQKVGIDCRVIGNDTIEVKSLPQILGKIAASTIVLDLLEQVRTKDVLQIEDAVDKMVESMACKAAIKAGDVMSQEEILALLKRSGQTENPFHCPHGRPTTLKITWEELEKYFHRK